MADSYVLESQSHSARGVRRVKMGSSRVAPGDAWADPASQTHSSPAIDVPGTAGWQCSIEDRDNLVISTVQVPHGAQWTVELKDERWERSFVTRCTEPHIALRLGRGSKFAPSPLEPVRVSMRFCLWPKGTWSEWTTLSDSGGGATLFIPLGLEDLRPAFEQFNRTHAPPGHSTYKELEKMLKSIGVDTTTKAAKVELEKSSSRWERTLRRGRRPSARLGAPRAAQRGYAPRSAA